MENNWKQLNICLKHTFEMLSDDSNAVIIRSLSTVQLQELSFFISAIEEIKPVLNEDQKFEVISCFLRYLCDKDERIKNDAERFNEWMRKTFKTPNDAISITPEQWVELTCKAIHERKKEE